MDSVKDIQFQKDVQMKWSNNTPTRNNLLEPVVGVSGKITAKKYRVVETLDGKQPHEIFE